MPVSSNQLWGCRGITMKNNVLYYSVGALLYCPANKESVSDSIIHETFGTKYSLALCLEDTINDDYVTEAEQILIASLNKIFIQYQIKPFYLPKIFIRVRNLIWIMPQIISMRSYVRTNWCQKISI